MQKRVIFYQRTLFPLMIFPVFILAIYSYTWTYCLFFLSIVILSMIEFYKILEKNHIYPFKLWGIFCSTVLYLLVYGIAQKCIAAKYMYILFPFFFSSFFLALYIKKKKIFTNLVYTLVGILYIGLPLSLLHLIIFKNNVYTPNLLMGILLIVWTNDIVSYCVGSVLGRHKLFKRISPNKTWEGSIGGAFAALIVGYSMAYYFPLLILKQWLILSVIIIVTSTYGDLIESLFKRSMHTKNSGKFFPGHGGILDRCDGFLISIPFVLAYLKIFL